MLVGTVVVSDDSPPEVVVEPSAEVVAVGAPVAVAVESVQ